MEHYREFVSLAHSKGIKVIQDVVMNHAGPVFCYDANGNGEFDVVEVGDRLRLPVPANSVVVAAPAMSMGITRRRIRPEGKRCCQGTAANPDKLPLLRSRPGGVRLPNLHGP